MISIIFDTETTGLLLPSKAPLRKQPFIIEVGAIAVDESGAELRELSQLLEPPLILDPKITKITGIQQRDLEGQPTFAEFLPQMREFFAGADVLVCHNAPFDVGMLKNELARVSCDDFPWPQNTVCTVQEYTHLFGRRPKLTELHERVLGRPLAQTHRALDDVRALRDILIGDGFFKGLKL